MCGVFSIVSFAKKPQEPTVQLRTWFNCRVRRLGPETFYKSVTTGDGSEPLLCQNITDRVDKVKEKGRGLVLRAGLQLGEQFFPQTS